MVLYVVCNAIFAVQIKLLQGAANAYTIERDARFSKWFESVLIMDEREAFELSCQIEPLVSAPAANSGVAAASSGGKESRFRRRITPTANHRQEEDNIEFFFVCFMIRQDICASSVQRGGVAFVSKTLAVINRPLFAQGYTVF